jgi:putative chitinase
MLLKLGSKSEEVKKIQEKLGLSADGTFGPLTETAVKEFQSKNGLTSDGIVNPDTWDKLFSTEKPAVKPDVATKPSSVGNINLSKLKGHVPDSVLSEIPTVIEKFGCNTPLRLAHFLAQCAHESGNFKFIEENLNYSSDGLKKIFPKYFPNNLSESYARNPEKIASRVYGGRMGNGDESTKEGYKFRGRGYIQLTGKENYTKFGKFIGEDTVSNPDLVSKKYPLTSAAFFFNSNNLWSLCDKGSDDNSVVGVSKRVNGGTIGLADRIKHFKEYYKLLK